MNLIYMLITSFLNIIYFLIGIKIAQKQIRVEKIKIPSKVSEKTSETSEPPETSEIQKELEKMKIISENIDNYDGTGFGQKKI